MNCFQDWDTVYTPARCCGGTYDPCFALFLEAAARWNGRTCDDYVASEAAWFTRGCLVWAQGDREYEKTVATDIMETGLARCYHIGIRGQASAAASGFGLCTPTPCGDEDVLENIYTLLDVKGLMSLSSAQDVSAYTVTELVPWRALGERVDFVIAGFMNSGTSTLVETLASHPEVELYPGELDIPQVERLSEAGDGWSGDWRTWLCADVLPKRWLDTKLPKERSGKKLRGFKNPLLLYSPDCVRSLARASPKLLVAVRDPVEWLLSIFDHKEAFLGQALHDWAPPSAQPERANWFGRDHARFGTALADLLEAWPESRVLALELEHLKRPRTAEIALDAACTFLGVRAMSALQDPGPGPGPGLAVEEEPAEAGPRPGPEPGRGRVRYSRGLAASSRAWGRAELCAPERAAGIRAVAQSLQAEYELLPKLLARIGVQELGVSATLLAGGAFGRHCREEVGLPGASAGAAGRAEQLVVERRLKVAWRGELGYEFKLKRDLKVISMGCGAGNGAPKAETRVTLWDSRTRAPIWVATMGPGSLVSGGFAYAEPFPGPLKLRRGQTYALSVQATPGFGVAPTTHAGISITADFAEFLGGVYSHGPWLYPSVRDEHSWEQAYVALVVLVPVI